MVSPMAETTTAGLVAGGVGVHDPPGDALDARRVRHRGTAKFLHDKVLRGSGETGSVCGCDPGWISVVGKLIRAPSLEHRGSEPATKRRDGVTSHPSLSPCRPPVEL